MCNSVLSPWCLGWTDWKWHTVKQWVGQGNIRYATRLLFGLCLLQTSAMLVVKQIASLWRIEMDARVISFKYYFHISKIKQAMDDMIVDGPMKLWTGGVPAGRTEWLLLAAIVAGNNSMYKSDMLVVPNYIDGLTISLPIGSSNVCWTSQDSSNLGRLNSYHRDTSTYIVPLPLNFL